MTTFIALLRGINVGGNRMLPMADLRECISAAGFDRVRSYIASGNLIVDGTGTAIGVESRIAAAIAKAMAVKVECIVRTTSEWQALIAANPWQEAARERPRMLHPGLSKHPLAGTAVKMLRPRLIAGEMVTAAGGTCGSTSRRVRVRPD